MGLPLAWNSESDGDTFRDGGSINVLLDATLPPGEVGGDFFVLYKDWNRSSPFVITYFRGCWSGDVTVTRFIALGISWSCAVPAEASDSSFTGTSVTKVVGPREF